MRGSFIHQDFTKEVKRLYKIVNMKQGNNQGSFQIEFFAWKLLNLSEITVIKNFFNQIQPEVEMFHHWLNKVHEDINTIMHKSNCPKQKQLIDLSVNSSESFEKMLGAFHDKNV